MGLPGSASSLASGKSGWEDAGAGADPGWAGASRSGCHGRHSLFPRAPPPAARPQRHFEHRLCFPVSVPLSSLLLLSLQVQRLATLPGLPGLLARLLLGWSPKAQKPPSPWVSRQRHISQLASFLAHLEAVTIPGCGALLPEKIPDSTPLLGEPPTTPKEARLKPQASRP